jgi:hypothetical protein
LDSISKAASCCLSAWEMIKTTAERAKLMQVSNILKVASVGRLKV